MSEDGGFVLCMVGLLFLLIEGGIFWGFANLKQIRMFFKSFFGELEFVETLFEGVWVV